jgi:CO/xanthine dehydrogenase FAD-binding subunit
MMKLRMGEFPQLIDIGRLKDLPYIEQRGDTLHIGALARRGLRSLRWIRKNYRLH